MAPDHDSTRPEVVPEFYEPVDDGKRYVVALTVLLLLGV